MLDTSLVPRGVAFIPSTAVSHGEMHTHTVNLQEGLILNKCNITVFNATALPNHLRLEVVNEQSGRRLYMC